MKGEGKSSKSDKDRQLRREGEVDKSRHGDPPITPPELGDWAEKHPTKCSKAARNQTILVKALAGKGASEIASELGIHRQTVSKVLKSDVVREKIKEIDDRLAQGIDDAVETILKAAKSDPGIAKDLLRNFGSMRTAVRVEHTSRNQTLAELLSESWTEADAENSVDGSGSTSE